MRQQLFVILPFPAKPTAANLRRWILITENLEKSEAPMANQYWDETAKVRSLEEGPGPAFPSGCDVILVYKSEGGSFAFLHRKEVKHFPSFVTDRACLSTMHRKALIPVEHLREGTVEVAVFARVEKGRYNWIRITVAPVSHLIKCCFPV